MGPEEEGRGLMTVGREGRIQRLGRGKVADEKKGGDCSGSHGLLCSLAWFTFSRLTRGRLNPGYPRMSGPDQGPPTSDPKKVSLRSASCLGDMASRNLGQELSHFLPSSSQVNPMIFPSPPPLGRAVLAFGNRGLASSLRPNHS